MPTNQNVPASRYLGASVLPDRQGTYFRVWAPYHRHVDLNLHSPGNRLVAMDSADGGYFEVLLDTDATGCRYTFLLDGKLARPDPASSLQEEGVHGPSTVVSRQFDWKAIHWRGVPLSSLIIYELHVGTFTREGTLDAAIERIPYLLELGITAVELMPLAQFPGTRNWGYDGVFPFAVQSSYGGPVSLKRFVDACHQAGIAVILDVVYNHLGPEGNYLRDFGPYFTARHHTPWGDAINYDGPESSPVRHFFLQNALRWVTEFRIDALRLDATDTIIDTSPTHFLAELSEALHQRADVLNRRIHAIAESAANDVRWIQPQELGGYGLDAQWNDDFHHALRHALTGEVRGYYGDYREFRHLIASLKDGFVYRGQYSEYRKRHHGCRSASIPPHRLVVCCQNHDQVGNRMRGDRLGHSVDLAKQKLAAAWVLLSPYIPLLFMGEEYNEPAPFPYFVSHGDPGLVKAVQEGRKKEFAAFAWEGDPPDPQAMETFESARIEPEARRAGVHAKLLAFYRRLIQLRKEVEPFLHLSMREKSVVADNTARVIWTSRRFEAQECVVAFSFSEEQSFGGFPFESGLFRKLLDSHDSAALETPPEEAASLEIRNREPVELQPAQVLVLERLVRPIARKAVNA